MSAEAILGVHRDASAWQPLPWIGVISSAGWRAAGPGDRVDRYHRVDELCEQMAMVCASAVDPLEIAAALEFEGMADRTVRERYGFPDVFALAEEMYQRVPLQPSEPAQVPATRRLGIGRSTLAFGTLAPALVVVPIMSGPAGPDDAALAVTLLAVPLSLSLGAAVWCVSRYRRTTQRMLRQTSRLGQFGGRARRALLGATVRYLAAMTALTCAASLIAVNLSPVRPDRAMVAILVGGIALGGAMFVALLLLAFDRCEITVLACAGAVGVELLFRGWGPAVVSYLGLFAFLGGYALVVLGRAGPHAS